VTFHLKQLFLKKNPMNRIIIFLLLISSHFSSGQYFPARIEHERQLDPSLSHGLLTTLNNKQVISLSVDKRTAYIDLYDMDSLDLLAHEPIIFSGADEFNLEVQGSTTIRNRFTLLVAGRSKTNKQLGVFLYPVLENGKLGNASQKTILDYEVSADDKVQTYIKTNKNQSFLLVGIIIQDAKGKRTHQVFVYDPGKTLVFQKKFQIIDNPGTSAENQVFYVFGEDHLYELWGEERYSVSDEKFRATLELNQYDLEDFKTVRKQTIQPEEGFLLRNFCLRELGEGFQIVASCRATSGKTITGIRGVYSAGLNEDWNVEYANIHPFSKEVRAEALNGNDHAEVPLLYTLKSMFVEGSGAVYFFYERTIETVKGKTVEYDYGPIIAAKIDYDGGLEWSRFIEKSQISKGNQVSGPLIFPEFQLSEWFSQYLSKNEALYLSFYTKLKNDNIYLVYNDNVENKGLTVGQKRKAMTDISRSVPFVIRFSDDEGNVEYEPLEGMKTESGIQRIKSQVPKSNGYDFFIIRDSDGKEVLQRINYF
jgi:hypothetical protein